MSPKFNFIPERQLNKEPKETGFGEVAIYGSQQIVFSKEMVDLYEMAGKFIRLYVETPHRLIAWKILEGNTTLPDLNDARLAEPQKPLGTVKFSIKKMMSALGIQEVPRRIMLPIKAHKSSVFDGTMYYIEMPTQSVLDLQSEKTKDLVNQESGQGVQSTDTQ